MLTRIRSDYGKAFGNVLITCHEGAQRRYHPLGISVMEQFFIKWDYMYKGWCYKLEKNECHVLLCYLKCMYVITF
jgi:hypothetical protein